MTPESIGYYQACIAASPTMKGLEGVLEDNLMYQRRPDAVRAYQDARSCGAPQVTTSWYDFTCWVVSHTPAGSARVTAPKPSPYVMGGANMGFMPNTTARYERRLKDPEPPCPCCSKALASVGHEPGCQVPAWMARQRALKAAQASNRLPDIDTDRSAEVGAGLDQEKLKADVQAFLALLRPGELLSTAVGAELDRLAGRYGIQRFAGETDANMRVRIRHCGTKDLT